MRSFPLFMFVLAAGMICIPILLHPYLPLVDLPNHIARLYIAATSETALDQYYSYDLSFQTNTAVDFLWLKIGQSMMSAEVFSNAMIAVYAVGFIAAIMVLSRVVHGHWSIWPLAANLVVFNASYFFGFANYLLTVPAAIFAFALWLWLDRQSVWVRAIVFTPICICLYAMHILGLLILIALVFGREVQLIVMAKRSWLRVLGRNIPLAIPFAIATAMLFYAKLAQPENLFGNFTRYGTFASRIEALTSPFHVFLPKWPLWFHMCGGLIFFTVFMLFLTLGLRAGPRLRLEQKMIGPSLSLLVLVLCIPTYLTGVGFVHIRFPFVLIGILIAASTWVELKPRQSATLFSVLIILSAARSISVEYMTREHSNAVRELRSVLAHVPDGARILPVRDHRQSPDRLLWHMQAHAVPAAHAFVPTLFLGSHGLKLDEAYWESALAQGLSIPIEIFLDPPPANPNIPLLSSLTLLENWEEKFTHVLVLTSFEQTTFDGLPLQAVSQSGEFTLFRIE